MRKKILIIDNFDSFTFNLADYFRRFGCEVDVYRNTIDPLIIPELKPDAIVFSPGPSVPKNAGNMIKIIGLYHQKYPMLGVCLGHQALVEYFGGKLKFVTPVHGEASTIEHDGKTIFKNIPQGFLAGRYHSLAADIVPRCFDVSATHKDLVMAIRHKTLPIEGVQFHPESVLTMRGECGLSLIKNFLDTYVDSKSKQDFTILSFLEKSIRGELSVEEQECFLRNHENISPKELRDSILFLQKQIPESLTAKDAIDICGTGGSGLARINTSTIASFIVASLGVKIAKHGNKAASGRFGSFDLLESLGINFESSIKDMESIYKIEGLIFLFARRFHPILKQFAEVRKKIGKPTFFNLLGPLLSPVRAEKQVIGTAFRDKMDLIIETCRLLRKKHVYVVCGEDGLDEVTLGGKTFVTELNNGIIKKYTISPKDFGVKSALFTKIQGGDGKENTATALGILNGKCTTKHLDLVLINAALILKLGKKAKTLKGGYVLAKKTVENGLAFEKFERIKTLSYTPSILLEIVKNKTIEITERKRKIPLEVIKKNIQLSNRNFLKVLSKKEKALIAEIKKKSPTGGKLCPNNTSVSSIAQIYEQNGAQAISVVCDKKFFGGDLRHLSQTGKATKQIPILCKDFIIDEYQIYEARKYGADAILLIAAILTEEQMGKFIKIAKSLNMAAPCEVHSLEELKKVLRTPAKIIGINNRDLHTFEIDISTTAKIARHIPKGKLIVSESGFFSGLDIKKLPKNVDAILVGTALMKGTNINKFIFNKPKSC